MNISFGSSIAVNDVLWRQDTSNSIEQPTSAKSTGQRINSDKVYISSEAKVLAELQKATTTPGYFGRTTDLLTDAEKAKFEKISNHYDGKKDKEINDLAISLAMDKIMAFSSKTELPTLDKDYLLAVMNSGAGDESGTRSHSMLDLPLVADILDNSYLLA